MKETRGFVGRGWLPRIHGWGRVAALLLAVGSAARCGDSGSGASADARLDAGEMGRDARPSDAVAWDGSEPGDGGGHSWTLPMCVWNQAYQENYEPDSVADILAGARGCYVLLDPFDSQEAREAIGEIQAAGNLVGCYMSVGTCEDWRDDYDAMKPFCVDREWGQWSGEYFVDRTDTGLVDVMDRRIEKMASWGCDMVEFDNMDWAYDQAYRSEYGFHVTPEEAEAYLQTLCRHVRSKGMMCMAKSTTRGAEDFEGLTVESYPDDMDWWDHDEMQRTLDEGRLGIVVHYDETDCAGVYRSYRTEYGPRLSFICEDRNRRGYAHFNQ